MHRNYFALVATVGAMGSTYGLSEVIGRPQLSGVAVGLAMFFGTLCYIAYKVSNKTEE